MLGRLMAACILNKLECHANEEQLEEASSVLLSRHVTKAACCCRQQPTNPQRPKKHTMMLSGVLRHTDTRSWPYDTAKRNHVAVDKLLQLQQCVTESHSLAR